MASKVERLEVLYKIAAYRKKRIKRGNLEFVADLIIRKKTNGINEIGI